MTENDSNLALTLTTKRTISASREDIFQAWTQAEKVCQWFAPSADFTIKVPTMVLSVGGQYRIEMTNPEGQTFIAIGEYVEISAPEKLVFSWGWEGGDGGMLVTIELTEEGDRTQLCLTHEKLPDDASRDHHNEGWEGCLNRLDTFLS